MPRSLAEKLHAAGQQQLLRFWDELSPESRSQLAAQVEALDLNLVSQLYRQQTDDGDLARLAAIAEPPPAIRLDHDDPEFTVDEARAAGEALLAAGKVGAVLVAGGQGSRLGSDQPKGMFPIGPVSAKSLFQVLLEKILATRQTYGRPVPLYLMTSPLTHDETAAYLSEQEYFGLPKEEVQLFCQGQMPAVDAATGEILLAEKDALALSPDGHGGMLAAMDAAGCLEDCRRRGVEQLFYFQVDNPLCTVCDPALLGFHQLHQSEYSLQVVAKNDPLERVGNLVSCDGTLRIIEYSDLPEEAARRCNEDGSLKLWGGSIAVHVFDVDFLQRAAQRTSAPPDHPARTAAAVADAASVR
ncbi:MAG: UTP--glucose-1-phosphate uridylyltransferase, partial [Pirellulales bacterium]